MGGGKTIFIIDDHPPLIRDYSTIITNSFPDENFQFEGAINCKESYEKVMAMQEKGITPYVAIVDLQLPEYPEQDLFSGLEVALLIRKHFPTTKIIIATGFTEIAPTKTILEKVQPEAMLCKADIVHDTYYEVFKGLDAGQFYISKTVQEVLKNDLASKLKLDVYDFDILNHLNKGIATKDLPNHIGLSLSAIEKRKASLKFILAGKKCSDKELLVKAKVLGIV